MNKKWLVAQKFDADFESRFPEIDSTVLQLLFNRGLKNQVEIDVFLGPDYARDQQDPFLFKDMARAVERILQAKTAQEKVVVYGDYDADGVTATAALISTLRFLGFENLSVYIPDRLREGYGLNKAALEELALSGTNLIITVDCGIANSAEAAWAASQGIDVIITDHHLAPEKLPPSYATICPSLAREQYPFKQLAGVGVAFKVCQALLRRAQGNNEAFEKWLLDLVAIGTVADCMPLLGENRILVKWGLVVLNKTKRAGLRELFLSAGINRGIDSRTIAFQIAPRLNAAGRMDHANNAYELLVTEDEAEALAIANDLNEKNQMRQKATDEMMKISLEQIGTPGDGEKILFSQYDGWSPGLVGLAAGKLADRFSRPAIVFGKMGDKYVGSGRSIAQFNMVAALDECGELLEEYGGHAQACGVSIVGKEKLKKFKQRMAEIAGEKLRAVELKSHLDVEAEIDLAQANWDLLQGMEKFAPFGAGNPEPVFVSWNLTVEEITAMGASGQHLKLMLTQLSIAAPKKFVGFGLAAEWLEKLTSGVRLDVAYKMNVNEWNGKREIEFRIEDIKFSSKR